MWKHRRVYGYIEQHVLLHRQQGVNCYETLLAPKLKHLAVAEYGVSDYPPARAEPLQLHQEKRRIVKQKANSGIWTAII